MSSSPQRRLRLPLLVLCILGCTPPGKADLQITSGVLSSNKVYKLYLSGCQAGVYYYPATTLTNPSTGEGLPIWLSPTPPPKPPPVDCTLTFYNATGTLVASDTGGTIWQSGPANTGTPPYALEVSDSGIVGVMDVNGLPVWALNCPPGYVVPDGLSTCTACPNGQTSTIGSACTGCPSGLIGSPGGGCAVPDHLTTPFVDGGYGSVQIFQLRSAAGLYSLQVQLTDCTFSIQDAQGVQLYTTTSTISGPCDQLFLQVDSNIVFYNDADGYNGANGLVDNLQPGILPYTLTLQDNGMLSLVNANGGPIIDFNCPPGYIASATSQICTPCPQGKTSLTFNADACVTPPPSQPPPPELPPPSPPPPPPSPPQASGSSGSNDAAIIGGVVGGVAGLLLLCLCCMLCFFCLRKREGRAPEEPAARATLVPAHGQKPAAELRAAPGTPQSGESYWRQSAGKQTESTGREPSGFTPGTSTFSTNSRSDFVVVPLGLSRLTNVDDGGPVVASKRLPASGADCNVHAAVDFLISEARGQVDNRYVLSEFSNGRIRGGQGEVVLARGMYSGSFAIKFFADEAIFEREVSIYQLLAQAYPADRVFVHDAISHKDDYLPNGMRMPSYLVMHRGYSMHEWVNQRKPPALMALWLLGEVSSQVSILHANGLVHRDLKPANLLWLQDTTAWRVIDFGCTVPEGTCVRPEFTLRYAPPEVIAACVRDDTIVAKRSMDVWAIGVIAFEIISGESLFPEGATSDVMRAILIGDQPFPHELDDRVWLKLGRLRDIVKAMLSREPDRRPAVKDVSRLLDDMAVSTQARTALYTGDAKTSSTSLPQSV